MTNQDHIEWLRDRQTGIGGSDAAAVLGVHPFKSTYELWEEKTSDLKVDMEINFAMRMGIVLEPIAAEMYAEETGRKIRRQPQKRHPEYQHMIGNVDRQILAVGDVQSTGILEIKCPQIRTIANVKAHGLPPYLTTQLMHYLGVFGYSWGSFALFNQNAGLIHFDLEADQEFIELLIEKEKEFWNNHVMTMIPPPEEDNPVAVEIPQVEGELTIINDPEWNKLATDLQEAQSLRKSAQQLEDVAKDQIKELMHREEIHAAEVAGFARFYYKMFPGRMSWKKTAEALAKEAKLDLNNFEVKGKGYKKFSTFFIGRGE